MSAVHTFEIPSMPVRSRHLRALPDVPAQPAGGSGVARSRFARRRFAALLVLCVVLGGAFLAGRAFASDDAGTVTSVTVTPGETLSGVAEKVYPNVPQQQAVLTLQQANNLGSAHVDAGQRLVVPAR